MKYIHLAIIITFVGVLSACGLTKKDLGLEHRGPNEAMVQTNTPLILPPEYSVRPARSTTYQPEETATTED